jgi:hypothetical protein
VSQPARVEYRIVSLDRKWKIAMLSERASSLSDETLRFGVSADSNGAPVDPTSATVEVAFMASYADPGEGDWHAATWDTTLIRTYVACVKTGATGAELTAGRYYTWVRITDPSSAEIVVRPTGLVLIS